MSDKKLTDEEIIKCLERCVKRGNRNYDTDMVLDLINRQKAEIERLKSDTDEKFCQWDMLAEKTKQHYADLYEEAKDILKAEAYKEFAEKLKDKIIDTPFGINCTIDMVDNFLKEMVGKEE